MPGRICSVCAHPARATIDRELARGVGATALSRQQGLTVAMLRHHRVHHLLYLLDPALGLDSKDLAGLRTISITTRRRGKGPDLSIS
jgi:hypothetical protein